MPFLFSCKHVWYEYLLHVCRVKRYEICQHLLCFDGRKPAFPIRVFISLMYLTPTIFFNAVSSLKMTILNLYLYNFPSSCLLPYTLTS